jgi:hypothetical protein
MKKYFLKGTGEELEFGDEIQLEMECKFHPDIADMLIEDGIIEEKETISFAEEDEEDSDEAIDAICEDLENLDKRVEALEKLTKSMYNELIKITDFLIEKEEIKGKTKVKKTSKDK